MVSIRSSSIFLLKSWLTQANLSVLFALFLTSSETVNASLDNVTENGDFFSNLYVVCAFSEKELRLAAPPGIERQIRQRLIACKGLACCLNIYLTFSIVTWKFAQTDIQTTRITCLVL